MKHFITLSLAVLVTLPVLAAPKARKAKQVTTSVARQLPSEPGRLKRLLAQYEAATGLSARDKSVRPNGVGDMRSMRLLLIPAAGAVRGARGEFFRSDVTLISNNTTDHQHVLVLWLQNGVDTDDPPAIELTLDPETYYTFTDFVGTQMDRENELGSLFFVPIADDGDIDFAGASLDGFSRIWTNQPNATGTVSQPFEAVDPFSFYVFETASIMGLRHDAQYRTNFGISNVDDVPHTFVVRFLGDTATNERTVVVPAGGMIHQGIPSGTYGNLVIEVSVDDPVAPWVAYGTSQDNITGDGWVSIGSGILTPEDLDDIDGGF
jgi:hypothetical protein